MEPVAYMTLTIKCTGAFYQRPLARLVRRFL